jgi:hypothetical protein
MTDPSSLAALADIELPDAPVWPSGWMMAAAVSIAVVAALAALMWRRARGNRKAIAAESPPSPRDEAIHRIEALRSEWAAGKLGDREATYRLCALLRIGLGLPQLEAAPAPHFIPPRDWETIVALLRRVRYRRDGRGIDERMFDRASAWLRAAGSPHHA